MDNNNVFRDFIPAEEDGSAWTDDGFQDFVPAPEPQPQVIDETPVEEVKSTPEDVPVKEEMSAQETAALDEPFEPVVDEPEVEEVK